MCIIDDEGWGIIENKIKIMKSHANPISSTFPYHFETHQKNRINLTLIKIIDNLNQSAILKLYMCIAPHILY